MMISLDVAIKVCPLVPERPTNLVRKEAAGDFAAVEADHSAGTVEAERLRALLARLVFLVFPHATLPRRRMVD